MSDAIRIGLKSVMVLPHGTDESEVKRWQDAGYTVYFGDVAIPTGYGASIVDMDCRRETPDPLYYRRFDRTKLGR